MNATDKRLAALGVPPNLVALDAFDVIRVLLQDVQNLTAQVTISQEELRRADETIRELQREVRSRVRLLRWYTTPPHLRKLARKLERTPKGRP